MKIEQGKTPYRPIIITLETELEAEALITLVDFLEQKCWHCLKSAQKDLCLQISNAFTNDLKL